MSARSKAGRLARQLEEQEKALEKTLEDARRITEAAEVAEPALSGALYDAARKAETGGTKSSMEAARDLASVNDLQGAQQEEQQAAKGVTELRANIERAAEKVLGSETEALRVARAELDKLKRELEAASKEEAAGKDGAGEDRKPQPGADKELADAGKGGNEGSKEAKEGQPSDKPGGQSGGEKPARSRARKGRAARKSPWRKARAAGSPGSLNPVKTRRPAKGNPAIKTGNPNQPAANLRGTPGRGAVPSPARMMAVAAGSSTHPRKRPTHNPITGGGYDRWSDRLRNVEELLETPELRNQAARIRDEARQMRIDHRRNDEPPQAAVVSARITQPLAELRDRVAEELARRESANPLAPLDHDPVPARFREQVRRYYTELGAGK